jgi:hypothetical protein
MSEVAKAETPNPKDLNFIINGEQINKILSVMGRLPYEQVFQAIDVIRDLKRIEVKTNETQEG